MKKLIALALIITSALLGSLIFAQEANAASIWDDSVIQTNKIEFHDYPATGGNPAFSYYDATTDYNKALPPSFSGCVTGDIPDSRFWIDDCSGSGDFYNMILSGATSGIIQSQIAGSTGSGFYNRIATYYSDASFSAVATSTDYLSLVTTVNGQEVCGMIMLPEPVSHAWPDDKVLVAYACSTFPTAGTDFGSALFGLVRITPYSCPTSSEQYCSTNYYMYGVSFTGISGYEGPTTIEPETPIEADTYGIIYPNFDYTFNSTDLWVNISSATTTPLLSQILANVGLIGSPIQPFAQFIATGSGCTSIDEIQIATQFGQVLHFDYTYDGDCDYQINTGFAYVDDNTKATGTAIVFTNTQGYIVQYTFLEAELGLDMTGTGYGNTLFSTQDGGVSCDIPFSPYDPTSLTIFTYACGYAPLSPTELCKYTDQLAISQLACIFEASARQFSNYVIGNQFGLTAVITAPISFLSTLAAGDYECTPLNIPFPYIADVQNITITCFTETVYEVYMPELLVVWQFIVTTIVLYYLSVKTLQIVKRSHDPDDDKIEVMKL